MNFSFQIILEAMVLASALSMDTFLASFAYGNKNIKIPWVSVLTITIICSFMLGTSLLVGTIFRQYISASLTTMISFSVLFVLGLVKLLDSVTKSLINKYNSFKREITFSAFHIKFILNLYANPTDADVDASKVISPGEATMLALALSLDGLGVGFAAAVGNVNAIAILLCALVTDTLAVITGFYFGNKLARKVPFQISWLSGLLLISLAFLKLI